MPSPTTLSKVAAAAATTTGASGLGLAAFAVLRLTPASGRPMAAWAELAALGAAAACVSLVRLVLDYRLKKLDAQLRQRAQQAAADLQLTRLQLHRMVLEQAAAQPQLAAAYRELIIANATYLAVEQNGEPLLSPPRAVPVRTLESAGTSSADIRRTAGTRPPRAPTIAPAPPLLPREPS